MHGKGMLLTETRARLHSGLPLEEPPVFLIGAERSGTTLLRLILDHHPQIRFHHEFEYAVDHVGDDGRLPSVDAYAAAMATDRVFKHAGEVINGSDYRTIVDNFLREKQRKSGKRIIGATVHRSMDRLLSVWPEARFIHMLRDPRDVSRSIVAMGWAGNTWVAAERWLDAEQRWNRIRSRIGNDRFVEIRYENLVANTEGELKRICQFLDVPWDAAMLSYDSESTYSAPDPSLAMQWKRKAPPRDVQQVEARVGELLTDRGYEPSGLPALNPSPADIAAMERESRMLCAKFRLKRYGWRIYWTDFIARRLRLHGLARRMRLRMNEIDEQHLK
jgi:hypothetical protein